MNSHHQIPSIKDHKPTKRRIVVLTVLCIVFAILASSDHIHDGLVSFIATSEQIIENHRVLGACIFVALAAISAMMAFVSVALIIPIAVYTWGPLITVFLLWMGWILGGILAYSIARFLGRRVVRWLTAEAGLKRVESYINDKTPFSLVLLFQLALPSEIPGYLLGLVKYPLKTYLLALSIAELPYTLATVLLGDSLLNKRGYTLLSAGLLMIAFSYYAIIKLQERIEANQPSNND